MSEKIARLISNLLHPFLIGAILLIYLALFKEGLDVYQLLLIFSLDFLIPGIFALVLLKKKIVNDLDISDVSKRKYFYFPVCLFLLLTLPLFLVFNIPGDLILIQIGFFIWIVLWAIISLFYKISGHTGGAGFIYGVIYFLSNGEHWWVFLLLPVLAWSRVKLKQHTIDQTIAGGILGFLISYIVFRVLGSTSQ